MSDKITDLVNDAYSKEKTMAPTITAKVAEQIKSLGPRVEEQVIAALTERELKRRSEAVVTCIDKLAKMELDYRKLGPDIQTYDETGKETSSAFSKGRIKERNDAAQKINKFTNAIKKALENGDFNDVYGLGNSGGGGKDNSPAKDTDEG